MQNPKREKTFQSQKYPLESRMIGCSRGPIEPRFRRCRLLHGIDSNQDQEINTSFPDPRQTLMLMGDREEREVRKKIGCSMGPTEPKILKDGERCRLFHGADPNQDQEVNTSFPDPRQTLTLMGDREERNEKRWCGRNSDLRKAASKIQSQIKMT